MSCDQVRTALSALVDGEDAEIPEHELRAHLARCADCAAFADRASALRRATLLASAPTVPDRTHAIVAALEPPDRRPAALRIGLAAIGLVQLVVALPLLAGASSNMPVHDARHLAALNLAVAAGFLVAAWRPARVSGLLPVLAALVAALSLGAVLDVASGTIVLSAESPHLLAAGGLVVAWLLTRPPFASAAVT